MTRKRNSGTTWSPHETGTDLAQTRRQSGRNKMKSSLWLTTCALVALSTSSHAEVEIINQTDPMTDLVTNGVLAVSDDKKAIFGLLCDSGGHSRLFFSHSEFLTSSGEDFKLSYRIDGASTGTFDMTAGPAGTAGSLTIHFGPNPLIDKIAPPHIQNVATKKLRKQLLEHWTEVREIPRHMVQGQEIIVGVYDFRGQRYLYTFPLEEFAAEAPKIDC